MNRIICIFILYLFLCIQEGLSRGGRGGAVGGGRGSGRGRSSSRARGGGPSGSSTGSGGGDMSPGALGGIISGVLVGPPVLVCLCVLCSKCACGSKSKRKDLVIVNVPNRQRLSKNLNDHGNTNFGYPPPAYSGIDRAVFNVESKIKRTQLLSVPKTNVQTQAIRPLHILKGQKKITRKSKFYLSIMIKCQCC